MLCICQNPQNCACFGSTYTKIGTIQRRLAWPLCKDDTQIREAFYIFICIIFHNINVSKSVCCAINGYFFQKCFALTNKIMMNTSVKIFPIWVNKSYDKFSKKPIELYSTQRELNVCKFLLKVIQEVKGSQDGIQTVTKESNYITNV